MFTDTLLNIGAGRSAVVESAIEPEIDAISIDTVEECVGDPFEFLTGTYYENEMNMKNIENSIITCEYAYLKETGNEMVYEANVITNMFDNVGKAISIAWEHICAFFKKIYRQIDEFRNANKAWVTMMRTKLLKAALCSRNSVTLDCSKVKVYSYDYKSNTFNTSTSRIMDVAKTIFDSIKDHAFDIEMVYAKETDIIDDDLLDINKFKSYIIGGNEYKGNLDYKRKLVYMFRGDQLKTVHLTINDVKDIINEIDSYKKTKTSLDEMYTHVKKNISVLLKQAKKYKNKVVKDMDNKDDKKTESKTYHNSARALNALTSLLTLVNGTACRAITSHALQSKMLAQTVIEIIIRAEKK